MNEHFNSFYICFSQFHAVYLLPKTLNKRLNVTSTVPRTIPSQKTISILTSLPTTDSIKVGLKRKYNFSFMWNAQNLAKICNILFPQYLLNRENFAIKIKMYAPKPNYFIYKKQLFCINKHVHKNKANSLVWLFLNFWNKIRERFREFFSLSHKNISFHEDFLWNQTFFHVYLT